MRPSRTQHGDYGYAQQHRCKCDPCREARRLYAKGMRLDQHRGVSRKVPIEAVQSHVLKLIDAGITRRQILTASDRRVSSSQLLNIVRGHNSKGDPVRFVHRPTAASIMAVTYQKAMGEDVVVPALGIRRRVHALNRVGHTAVELAAACGISHSMMYELCLAQDACKSTVEKIHRGYEHLASIPGHNESVRWKAIRNEWAPPMAWEDHQLDDIDGEPDWSAVACVVEGCQSHHWKTGLCRTHRMAAEARGAFRDARRFREVVTSQHRVDRKSA